MQHTRLTRLIRATPGLRAHLIARSAHPDETAGLLLGAAHAAGPVHADAALRAEVDALAAQVTASYGRRPDDQVRAAQETGAATDLTGHAMDALLGRVSLHRALLSTLEGTDERTGLALVTGYALAIGLPPSRANLARTALAATPGALRLYRINAAPTLDEAPTPPLPYWGDARQYPGETSGVMCDHPCPVGAACLLHAASGTRPRPDTRYPGFTHGRGGCGHFIPQSYRGAAVTGPDQTPPRTAGRPRTAPGGTQS